MSKTPNLIFRISTHLFLAGVAVQVFLAGLTVVAGLTGWDWHETLGHLLGLPLIVMLIVMFVGKADSQVKRLTWILFLVYLLQADVLIFLRHSDVLPLQVLSALHPVLALIDFWLAARLLSATKA